MADIRAVELSFAHKGAVDEIEAECDTIDDPSGIGDWIDLGDTAGEVDLHDAIAYLDSRRLILRNEKNADWIRILDEDEPLPEPKAGE